MRYPVISELLKKQRKSVGLTLNDLEELVKVTASYISQVENGNKLPSERVLFLITFHLSNHINSPQTERDLNFKEKILTEYGQLKGLNINDFLYKYKSFEDEAAKKMRENLKDAFTQMAENKIKLKKGTLKLEGKTDLPYFDLQWLITQKEYEVFYGHYDIQEWSSSGDEVDDFFNNSFRSRLNDEDIDIIHGFIESYLYNRYVKWKEDRGE